MAKRRQNGEGTIYQRPNGLWVCEITLGYDADGKRQKKTVSSMDLEKLKKKINDLKYLNDRHMVAEPSKYTVADWVEFWLETYKKQSVKPTTYDMYHNALETYIRPNIGHYKLDALRSVNVQRFINGLAEKGVRKDTGLSESSIKKILITLSQAYDKAIALNMLFENPCADIHIPKKEKRKATAFTKEEQERFLSLCHGNNSFENLFICAFHTGMRLGELLALTWDDIAGQSIMVSKTLTVVNSYAPPGHTKTRTLIDTTKTEQSNRTIPLSTAACAAIKRQKERNKTQSPFVFCSVAGTPLMKRNIYRSFHKILEQAAVKSPVTFHSMRHSFVTRLLEKGADIKTVSELLGHKSIQITLDIYSHVSSDLKEKTISLLNE